MLKLILFIVSAILFGLAAFNVNGPKVQLGWAGACVFVIAALV